MQRAHGVGRPALGDVEDQLLGLVDRGLHVLGDRVADVGDLAGHPDEPAEQGVLLDDLRVVPRVGDRRGVGLQRDEDGRVADLLEQPRALELVGHRDGVDRLAPLHERLDRREDVPVGRLVEVAGRAVSMPDRCGVGRQQHGPEQDSSASRSCGGTRAPAVAAVHQPTGSAGAGVVEGLDHGSPTLTVAGWGTIRKNAVGNGRAACG